MATIYLHIGSSKTGTSAIQIFLGENRELFKKQNAVFPIWDIQYPTIRKQRNAHFLCDKEEAFEQNYVVIVEELKKLSAQYDKIILSDESVWNNPTKVERFVNDMKDAGILVKLVGYLRRQDLYLQSQWAQNVKEKATKSFYEFTQTFSIHLDYYEQVCDLSRIVGKENLDIRAYEKQQFKGGNLLLDFMQAIDVEVTEEFVFQEKADNLSLNGIYLETKRLLNRRPEYATRANFLVPYLYRAMEENNDVVFYNSNKFFTYAQQMEFLSRYEEGNSKIAKEYMGREDGVMYRDKIEKIEGGSETFTSEEYVDVLGQIMLYQQEKLVGTTKEMKEKLTDCNKEIKEKDKELQKKILVIDNKEKIIKEKDQNLTKKEDQIKACEKKIRDLEKSVNDKEQKIKDLENESMYRHARRKIGRLYRRIKKKLKKN